jgi:TRAP-type C4-dicarboxylate transport system substrate-binding protein
MNTNLVLRTVAAVGILAASNAVQADTMRIAHGFPAQSIIDDAFKTLAQHVEENTEMETDVFALTVLDLKQASPGLTSGVADSTMVLTAYFPNEFSEQNFVADLTMLANLGDRPTSIGATVGGALTEYVTMRCPECVRQNLAQNQIGLAFAPGSQFSLLCKDPIQSVSDVKGKAIRGPVSVFRRWAESMGASPITISANEVFDGLNQGLVDCTINAVGEMSNLSLFDVVGGITPDMPGGTFGGSGIGQLNLDFWLDQSLEDRAAIARGMSKATAFMITAYMKQQKIDLQTARDQGIKIVEPDEDLKVATEAFINDDVETIKSIYGGDFQLENVDEKVDTFVALIEKWKALTNPLDPTDTEALTELLWTEIHSKLDLETYGLN